MTEGNWLAHLLQNGTYTHVHVVPYVSVYLIFLSPASPGVSSVDPPSQPPTARKEAQYTPGGVFAGVGEFPPTLSPSGRKEAGMAAPQLPQLKYKPEAALRSVQLCSVAMHQGGPVRVLLCS